MSTTIRLLHVEDDVMQHKVIEFYLNAIEGYSFEIVLAQTEAEASEALQTNCFDQVILDYCLAEGDGRKCLQQIRENDPSLLVLVLSGADTELEKQLLEDGANQFLDKDGLTGAKLNAAIAALLENR